MKNRQEEQKGEKKKKDRRSGEIERDAGQLNRQRH